jgi:sulfate permease, SulP family
MGIKNILPILTWLPAYNRKHLKGDVSAGITVGIMLIPQGMAYAMLAGLPPIYGLYAALVPQFIYAFFGTSRQLGVGPVAMDSLLVAVAVSQFAQAGSENYIIMAVLLAFMVGLIQLMMGIMKLGFLVNLLSHPVISGFTSAAALIIGFSQLKYLLGVDLPRSQYLHEILWNAFQHISETNLISLLIGMTGILIIAGMKKIKSAIPAPMVVVVLGIIVVWLFGLDSVGVAIVSEVPAGLPGFQVPDLDTVSISQLFASAMTIALVAFMEAIAVAKAIHTRHNDYKIDSNQELIALGMANFVGSFFQSFPVTGGFSRSAVNDQAGAKTNLAAIISALFVMLTLLFLTPLFFYLPQAILASVIMMAVFKLISVKDAIDLWKNKHRRDLFILLITFFATLSSGIQTGIFTGVFVSVAGLLYDTMYPEVIINSCKFKLPSNVLLIRFDERLYFGNSNYFIEKTESLADEFISNFIEKGIRNKFIILDGSAIHHIDSTGEKALNYVIDDFKSKNFEVLLVSMYKRYSNNTFDCIDDALSYIKRKSVENIPVLCD